MVTQSTSTSFVLAAAADIPAYLRQRQGFTLPNTEMILRRQFQEVVAEGGRVVMAGATEFQTQITPGLLTDICDPERPTNRT